MLCNKCKKRPAIVFVQRMENGEMKNEGYCLSCARELGIKPLDDIMKQFGISGEDLEAMEDRFAGMMENGDKIKAELYPDVAPNTVNNFISLINKGFYDGLIFHRVIKNFMIQGGDPEGTGMGGPGYSIKGEFKQNGFDNNLKHDRGVLSMARSFMPDSAGSQFFIMHQDSPHLDGAYAAFGKVIEGMDAVDKIAEAKTNRQDRPKKDVRIEKVSVETFGKEYDEPETI